LPQSRQDLIIEAFKIYKIENRERRNTKAKTFIEKNHTMWCTIKFLGVFDTVAALGMPGKILGPIVDYLTPYKFHSFELSDSVECARQALSIDEERKIFSPVIWDPLKDKSDRLKFTQSLKQVWFSGVHTDVGGGYEKDDLANLSLKWMLREAREKGLLIYEPSPAYQKLLSSAVNPDGEMHNEQKGLLGKLYSRKQRSWDHKAHGAPVIHSSVLKRIKNNGNSENPKYSPWVLSLSNPVIEE
jgi:uncharacterized protein (DUF2235 family)